MIFIRISINNTNKTVQFWLTTQERENNSIMEEIKTYADEHTTAKKKNDIYKKVIFVSGTAPLVSVTADLLKRNR